MLCVWEEGISAGIHFIFFLLWSGQARQVGMILPLLTVEKLVVCLERTRSALLCPSLRACCQKIKLDFSRVRVTSAG